MPRGTGFPARGFVPPHKTRAAHPCAAQRRNRLLFRYVPSAYKSAHRAILLTELGLLASSLD